MNGLIKEQAVLANQGEAPPPVPSSESSPALQCIWSKVFSEQGVGGEVVTAMQQLLLVPCILWGNKMGFFSLRVTI